MNNQAASERRFTAAATKPVPQGIDRFENEGGPGPADTSQQRPDEAPVVPMEIVLSELPLPDHISEVRWRGHPDAGDRRGGRPEPGDRHGWCLGPFGPGSSPKHSRAPVAWRIARSGRGEHCTGPGPRDRRRGGRSAPRAAPAGPRRCQGLHRSKRLTVPSSTRASERFS